MFVCFFGVGGACLVFESALCCCCLFLLGVALVRFMCFVLFCLYLLLFFGDVVVLFQGVVVGDFIFWWGMCYILLTFCNCASPSFTL